MIPSARAYTSSLHKPFYTLCMKKAIQSSFRPGLPENIRGQFTRRLLPLSPTKEFKEPNALLMSGNLVTQLRQPQRVFRPCKQKQTIFSATHFDWLLYKMRPRRHFFSLIVKMTSPPIHKSERQPLSLLNRRSDASLTAFTPTRVQSPCTLVFELSLQPAEVHEDWRRAIITPITKAPRTP